MKFCTNCVMPDTKPDLVFDSEGVCDACRSAEHKREKIDWDERKKEFENIIDEYRSRDSSNYDCLIPVSGGKDSTATALLVISTSGRSRNLIHAVAAAKAHNIGCIGLLGGSGGDLLPLVDRAICVPSPDPQRIQEVQLLALHLICEWIEADLLQSDSPLVGPQPEENVPVQARQMAVPSPAASIQAGLP